MTQSAEMTELAERARRLLHTLLTNLERVIRGKRESLELLLCCLAAGGHALLEDIPGTGKTTLAKALALSTRCVFKRVQFTPDLLPTDIVGSSILNPREGSFRFNRGPVFTNVLIADEINRASPRTQSALLEAMGEQQVTVDGQTYPLESPFFCIATQNPVEFHGTYPLPEAQLDRFSVHLTLGYVTEEEERRILTAQQTGHPLNDLEPVAGPDEIVALQHAADQVMMEDSVMGYLLRLVAATRNDAAVRLGVSTRGSLQFARMARARALLCGRDFVLPEDVKRLAVPVLAHRLVLDTRARYAGTDKRSVISGVLDKVAVPR
ncbi:MAG: MoxR family ATPase [Planctomycetaceae bacterium]|nr:MAG: MoxR family ATPase [Planctomycetaceae bacterium]